MFAFFDSYLKSAAPSERGPAGTRSRARPVEDRRGRRWADEEPVVEHLLEDLEIAKERGGRRGVAVGRDSVGVALELREAVGQGGMGRIVDAVMASQHHSTAWWRAIRRGADTRRLERKRRGSGIPHPGDHNARELPGRAVGPGRP